MCSCNADNGADESDFLRHPATAMSIGGRWHFGGQCVFKGLKPIIYNGQEVWPLVEGGKGVAATNHASSGAWAAAGGIGTISAVNADNYDDEGNVIRQVYHGARREERHQELIQYGIDGAVAQIRRAFEITNGKGAININVLWEMGGAQAILHGVLEKTRGMVAGVTCGAGMPYKLAEIAAQYQVNYLPIISSARAFSALWKRAYSKVSELMAAVVYEDPWLAGGHNGLSNAENPLEPQDPYPRVRDLRKTMRDNGIADSVPIVMAGGVWYLRDWENWIDNEELGQIAFQFGTRPLLTQESPIPQSWKDELTKIQEGDVLLHKFSPTGFYSSAVRNKFLRSLEGRSERQIGFSKAKTDDRTHTLDVGVKGKNFWVSRNDLLRAREWAGQGFDTALKTPDDTLVFVSTLESKMIRKDQADCMGCLSHCAFSAWKDTDNNSTGRLADPRSFCIQKALQEIVHGAPIEDNLMFAGHNAFNFGRDPFYSNGFVPTVKQLVDRILTGD
jgi:NAD(P)H-dependent flavin oxidoreductase YrpB (nitropropane dioxygenase family)